MVLLECVIVFVWAVLHGFLLQRCQEQVFFLFALVVLDSVEATVILVVVVLLGDLRCSQFRHVDSMMSSHLPVPIDLEGTTAELCRSLSEEESALPIPVTSLESASRGRVEGNLPGPINLEGTTAELSCSVRGRIRISDSCDISGKCESGAS